jgi:hypothetical protein
VSLFLPQVVTAICAAVVGAGCGGRFRTNQVYLAGLVAGLISTALLIVSSFQTGEETLAYALLLLATAVLGAGFGLSVPALNTLATVFRPDAVDRPKVYAGFAAGFAVLYGICETVNGNWSQLDMTSELGASTTTAALALTAFWGMVTLWRVVSPAIQSRFPSRRAYPFVLAGASVIVAVLLSVCWRSLSRARLLGAAHNQLQLRGTHRHLGVSGGRSLRAVGRQTVGLRRPLHLGDAVRSPDEIEEAARPRASTR